MQPGKRDTTRNILCSISFSYIHLVLYCGNFKFLFGKCITLLEDNSGKVLLNFIWLSNYTANNQPTIMALTCSDQAESRFLNTSCGLKTWVELTLPRSGQLEEGRLNSTQVFSPREKLKNLRLTSSLLMQLCLYQRRRINTEEKAKVVAAVWGTEYIHFLTALFILKYDDLNNRMNYTRMIWSKGWIHPFLQNRPIVQNS